MRIQAGVFVALLLAGVCLAQDTPLGDIARANRTKKTPNAGKVVTDEDLGTGGLEPINANEEPNDVITKARTVLVSDTPHRCMKQSAGNSGPGWTDEMISEVAGRDRVHVIVKQNAVDGELLLIGDDIYRRIGSAPWQKLEGNDARAVRDQISGAQFSQPMVFDYTRGELKSAGKQMLGAIPVYVYTADLNTYEMQRTIKIWVGANDHRPLRTEMHTLNTDGLRWQEDWSCEYGVNVQIEAPK